MKAIKLLLPAVVAVLAAVSCQKPLNQLTITLGGTEYQVTAGGTVEVPFTVGEVSGAEITASAVSANEDFDVEVALVDVGGQGGKVTVIAPEYTYSDVTFTVTLTVEDKVNARKTDAQFNVSCKPSVEPLLQAANTFIVKPESTFSFNAAKGSTAEGVDFDAVGLLWQDAKGLVDDVFINGGKIVVDLGTGEGNAVVYAKKGDVIVWSWTLWVCNEEPKDVTVGDFVFMDRNIGALNATPGSEFSNGNMYQWGRKDAFSGANAENGLKKMYDIDGKEVERAAGLVEVADNIANALANPLTHYYLVYPQSKGNYSWITNDATQIDKNKVCALWNNDGKKTEADPCPTGYKVASPEAWAAVASLTKTEIFDEKYTPSKEVISTWQEKYKDQYLLQSRFRGAKFGELPILGSGEYTHQMGYSQGFGGTSNNVVATIWTNTADADMFTKTSATYFRAISVKLSYSYSSKAASLSQKNKINFAYEQPVRCIKEK